MIFVGTQCCIKTGMCIRSNLYKTLNNDIVRQHRVHTQQKLRVQHINFYGDISVCKQLPGMDTGIGTSASQRFNILPAKSRKNLIDQLLNRKGIFLNLPPMIGRSIICDFYKISLYRVQAAKVMRKRQRVVSKMIFLSIKSTQLRYLLSMCEA